MILPINIIVWYYNLKKEENISNSLKKDTLEIINIEHLII